MVFKREIHQGCFVRWTDEQRGQVHWVQKQRVIAPTGQVVTIRNDK